MRYAVISDIHGNMEALEAVLKSIGEQNVNEIFCLGDTVGYGPNPNECVQKVREVCALVVVGNHDFVMVDESDLEKFSEYAHAAAAWTKSVLIAENVRYLAALPFTISFDDMLLAHASPSAPRDWIYILSSMDALLEFETFSEKFCLIGHTHVPVVFRDDGELLSGDVAFEKDRRYIVNAGSVGQPRDRDPRACYGILDTETLTFSLVRVEYDVAKVAEKIKNTGLPEILGSRLYIGR